MTELEELNSKATRGEWHVDMIPAYDEDSGAEEAPMCEGICTLSPEGEPDSLLCCREPEARFIVALVNAYRSGRIVELIERK